MARSAAIDARNLNVKDCWANEMSLELILTTVVGAAGLIKVGSDPGLATSSSTMESAARWTHTVGVRE